MSDLDAGETVFHGPDAPVLTFVTTDEIVTIAPTEPVRTAAVAIVEQSVGILIVGTPDDVIGVVSERDIVRAVAEELDLDEVTVSDIASRQVEWIDADDNIGAAAEEMMKDYVRHVLVRDEGGLVGVLSMRDVLSAYTT